MEQKQLDEVEDTYFGEEFIDESDLEEAKEAPKEEVKKETAAKEPKKEAKKTTKKKTSKKAEAKTPEPKKEETKTEEVEIKPASDPVEPVAPIDPWADDDDDEPGLFTQASTWKAMTGIAIILLVISVFTQGFHFAEGTSPTSAAVSLSQAEAKALDFVNTNLLQPPFEAELVSSTDADSLYMVTLSVAGQEVESYMTKDGKIFFPQGFDLTQDIGAELGLDEVEPEVEDTPEVEVPEVEDDTEDTTEDAADDTTETEGDSEDAQEAVDETASDEGAQETTESAVEDTETEDSAPEPVVEEPAPEPQTPTAAHSIAAKKWLFNPNELTVAKGSEVELTIQPSGLDFTFAIPGLNVNQDVEGETVVSFTADSVGEFTFSCASCEEWRGMTGTLTVE